MGDLNTRVRDFFAQYEKTIAGSEAERIAGFYADVFLFGDPESVRSVNKTDFVRVLPKRHQFFASVGLTSSTVESVEASTLDAKYVLAKTVWKMRFEGREREPLETRNPATYILFAAGDSFQIILQLDHQDLVKKAQELGRK